MVSFSSRSELGLLLPLAGALVVVVALSGCAGRGPLPQGVGQNADAQGLSAPAPVPLAQWWQRFDDPQLAALIVRALQANTSVRSAQAALQQARAQADVQGAGLLPSVDASGSGQRSRLGNETSNSFRVGLDAGWELDIWGRLRAGVDASQADARAAQASLANVQVSLAAEVASNYISVCSLQERLTIARRNLASQQETLQITDWRVQAGLSTSLVSEQARANTEQTAAQIPLLEANLAQSRHSLAVLTGQAPGALDALLARTGPVPMPPEDLAQEIPAQVLRQRPDVRVAEERITAALARWAQADAARYPRFDISGSVGLRALTLGALTGGASVTSALLGSVSVPLFDGGAARAQVRVQDALLEQARIGYEATVLAALKEVEDALSALRGDRERLLRLQNAAEAAANAALLAQNRYSSGLIDFQAVLETQRTLLSTQDSVASTRASVSADHVRLYKALGGGWAQP
ncbi:MAG: efflux transporter outer membrane subunit [Burkholderiaceae bacterium]|nr:efflux transporter outer membrane subunit [Burkholderiaceae bacterium]